MEIIIGIFIGIFLGTLTLIPGFSCGFIYTIPLLKEYPTPSIIAILISSAIENTLGTIPKVWEPISRGADPLTQGPIRKIVKKGKGLSLIIGIGISNLLGRIIGLGLGIGLLYNGVYSSIRGSLLYVALGVAVLMWVGQIIKSSNPLSEGIGITFFMIGGLAIVSKGMDFYSLSIGLFALPSLISIGGDLPPQSRKFNFEKEVKYQIGNYAPLLVGVLSSLLMGLPTSVMLNVWGEKEYIIYGTAFSKGVSTSITLLMALALLGSRSASDGAIANLLEEGLPLLACVMLGIASVIISYITLLTLEKISLIYLTIINVINIRVLSILSLILNILILLIINGKLKTLVVISMGIGINVYSKVFHLNRSSTLATMSGVPFFNLLN
jgi:hypothetical protein